MVNPRKSIEELAYDTQEQIDSSEVQEHVKWLAILWVKLTTQNIADAILNVRENDYYNRLNNFEVSEKLEKDIINNQIKYCCMFFIWEFLSERWYKLDNLYFELNWKKIDVSTWDEWFDEKNISLFANFIGLLNEELDICISNKKLGKFSNSINFLTWYGETLYLNFILNIPNNNNTIFSNTMNFILLDWITEETLSFSWRFDKKVMESIEKKAKEMTKKSI